MKHVTAWLSRACWKDTSVRTDEYQKEYLIHLSLCVFLHGGFFLFFPLTPRQHQAEILL